MSVTVELDLTESVAEKARARGLLSPAQLARMILRELEADEDPRDFFQMSRELRDLPGEPMTPEAIQRIVDEIRVERAARETGR